LPTIIQYLESEDNATMVCQLLGLCPSCKPQQQHQPKPVHNVVVVEETAKPTAGECNACQGLLVAIENWLEANSTETVIANDLLNVVCPLVPALETTCDQIFKFGVPTAITWLETSEDPATVCTQLGVCPDNVVPKPMLPNLGGSIAIN